MAAYDKAHLEKRLAYGAAYHKAHREKRVAQMAAYRKARCQQLRASRAAYLAEQRRLKIELQFLKLPILIEEKVMNEIRPMPDDLPSGMRSVWEKFSSLGIGQLKDLLQQGLKLKAKQFVEWAVAIRILEAAGEDLSDCRMPLLPYFRKIAHGQLIAEVLVYFADEPKLYNIIGEFDIAQQLEFVKGRHVPVVVCSEDGKRTNRMADPRCLTPRQRKQVFGKGTVRSEAEQNLRLDDLNSRAAGLRPRDYGTIGVDRATGELILDGKRYPAKQIRAALKLLDS